MNVILDSSFLITIATKPIKRMYILEDLECIVLSAIIKELKSLEGSKSVKRAIAARTALELIERMKVRIIDIKGEPIDDLIIEYADKNSSYIATLDKEMKKKAKDRGIGVITLSKDEVIIER
ncbi:MAG: hypothetical protein QW416_00695 [Candidatus Nitrosocaldaceae archaeon]